MEDPYILEPHNLQRMLIPGLFPFFLIFFYLEDTDYYYFFAGLLFLGLIDIFIPWTEKTNKHIFSYTFILFISTTVSYLTNQQRRKSFLKTWEQNYQINQDRNRMKQELEQARKVQIEMLPRSTPKFSSIDITHFSIPATEVGGDYYDFIPLSEKQIAIAIGDVSGHGLPTGLILSGIKSGLYILSDFLTNPKLILSHLNNMLCKTTEDKMFMTFLYIIIDTEKMQVQTANAGHTPLICYHPADDKVTEYCFPSYPLGFIPETQYSVNQIPLTHGDLLFIYTDGLTETMNEHDEFYGDNRFHSKIKEFSKKSKSVKEIHQNIMNDIHQFRGDKEAEDDITLIVTKIY